MTEASWIWYPGEYEIYHSNKLHAQREDFGIQYVTFWQVPNLYPRVDFFKTFEIKEHTSFKALSDSMGFLYVNGVQNPLNREIEVEPGKCEIQVRLMNVNGGLPCVYINSEFIKTEGSWLVTNGSENKVTVATLPQYNKDDISPEKFIFSYKKVNPLNKEVINDAVCYDFGRELYGPITVKNIDKNGVTVSYGESKEESLDLPNTTLKETVTGKKKAKLRSRAFRYITLFGDNALDTELSAEYEYLPLKDTGSFSCDDETIKDIYKICAYTFHLNSREFYLDGIKRDHWVWGGDAYQSFMINNYLYFDKEITKRTMLAPLGKPPYEQHINTINDYTLYLIISVWDFYFTYGDKEFVVFAYPRIKALYDFMKSRLDENGFVCKRGDDWIFIDWSDIDMQGPICAEQILLWKAMVSMSKISEICGKSGENYLKESVKLKKKVIEFYWDKEKNAFIDSYESGKNKVSRQANIFAILYDFVGAKVQKKILKTVLLNDEITAITTPYFKFFELSAFCKLNELEQMQKLLTSYWGGMIKLGATTVWEAFDPKQNGADHYAMYGNKYGKSLCHAWGSGPIYLLGRYCLGVYPTKPGYETFNVEPRSGMYKSFNGTVPLPDGKVEIEYCGGMLKVFTDKAGGTLIAGKQQIKLQKDKTVKLKCFLK